MAAQFCEERLGRDASSSELHDISRRHEGHLAGALVNLEPVIYRTPGSAEVVAAL